MVADLSFSLSFRVPNRSPMGPSTYDVRKLLWFYVWTITHYHIKPLTPLLCTGSVKRNEHRKWNRGQHHTVWPIEAYAITSVPCPVFKPLSWVRFMKVSWALAGTYFNELDSDPVHLVLWEPPPNAEWGRHMWMIPLFTTFPSAKMTSKVETHKECAIFPHSLRKEGFRDDWVSELCCTYATHNPSSVARCKNIWSLQPGGNPIKYVFSEYTSKCLPDDIFSIVIGLNLSSQKTQANILGKPHSQKICLPKML